MQIKVHALAAAFALSACLGACGDTGQTYQSGGETNPQLDEGGGTGYGPFGGDMPPPATAPPPFGQGGDETVVAGGGGGVPPEFQTLVSGYLDRYARQMAEGWSPVQGVPDMFVGLNPNSEHRWQVRLRAGQAYAFIGACDNECDNVDLILEDSSGVQIKADVLPDDYPLVDFTPQADGVYTVRVQLKTCSIGPCYVGVRLVRD